MKIIRYIDFFGQTLLFLTVLIILIGSLSGVGSLRDVLGMQLIVGSWQLLSCLISVGFRFQLYRLKRIHLIACVIYVALLFIIPFHKHPGEFMLIAFTVPAWSLAVFYYILTALATFQRPARLSSFLPHTSF